LHRSEKGSQWGAQSTEKERSVTVVAVWYEPHDDIVWMIADTRISRGGGSLTDGGAKILPLTLKCFEPGASGFFDRSTLATTLGYAYAGNTLPALMTYSVINTCLSNLAGLPNSSPPSILQVGAMALRVAERYVLETMADFTAVIAGWCPSTHRYAAIVIEPDPNVSPRRMRLREEPLDEAQHVTLLGSHRERVEEAVRLAYEQTRGQVLQRAPKIALTRLVESDELSGIGGSLQIGTASRFGFDLKYWVAPLTKGSSAAGRFLLGIDLDEEIGGVGPFRVGMMGTI
jgi:hypothetical protein